MPDKNGMTALDPAVGAAGKRSSYVKHYRSILAERDRRFNGFTGFPPLFSRHFLLERTERRHTVEPEDI